MSVKPKSWVLPARQQGPPQAGVGLRVGAHPNPGAGGDLVRALQLLQSAMSAEDVSKYEKLLVPPTEEVKNKLREQVLLEKVRTQERVQKRELATASRLVNFNTSWHSRKSDAARCSRQA